MRIEMRKSMIAKAMALNFIYLIILGNIWFVLFVTGQGAPIWLSYGFQIGVFLTFILGVALGVYRFLLPTSTQASE